MILAYMCMRVIMISICKQHVHGCLQYVQCHVISGTNFMSLNKHTYLEFEVLHSSYRTKLIPRALRLCYIQGGPIKT